MPTKEELKAAVQAEIDRRGDELIGVAKTILDSPETGFREQKTSRFVAEKFREFGIPYQGGIAITGLKGMLRRAFLKRMAFAAIASHFLEHIPIPMDEVVVDEVILADIYPSVSGRYYYTQYVQGFIVSDEMIEDDIYSTMLEHNRQLITRFNMPLTPEFSSPLQLNP